ncbi:ParA family protein [Vibrio harveyi]|uniref:ParA family protein n=1 Tax=Vibrio harveyi TaxID=669 RepID=UPI0030F5A550
MIISFLSQKGGVTKSTLARAVAVAFAQNDWSVHLADMDWQQQTCGKWTARRDEKKIRAVGFIIISSPSRYSVEK